MLFIVRPAGRFWEFLFLIKMRSEILSVQFFFFLAPRRGAPKKKKKPPPKKKSTRRRVIWDYFTKPELDYYAPTNI
jgi:hypothetical protein